MSQALNNPTGASHRDYGATASTSSSATPDVSFSTAGFSPTEFMSLSEDIAEHIVAINSSSKQLEKMLKQIATSKDSPQLREKVHTINTRANNRVEAASQCLQRLTTVVKRGDRSQKSQLDKFTTEFCSVVEHYTQQQKKVSMAMRQSYQNATATDHNNADHMQNGHLQLQIEQQELQQEHEMLLQHEQQVKQAEADVLDIQKIMTKISILVHEQGERIDTIETSIETATGNVEQGAAQLAKAEQSRQSYRRKILILLVIAVIIGLIVTGIIVSKLSS